MARYEESQRKLDTRQSMNIPKKESIMKRVDATLPRGEKSVRQSDERFTEKRLNPKLFTYSLQTGEKPGRIEKVKRFLDTKIATSSLNPLIQNYKGQIRDTPKAKYIPFAAQIAVSIHCCCN